MSERDIARRAEDRRLEEGCWERSGNPVWGSGHRLGYLRTGIPPPPGLLQGRWAESPAMQVGSPLRGESGALVTCLGGQGPERHRACSESHSELGQRQEPVTQPSVSLSESLCFIPGSSQALPPPCSHLPPCLLVFCRDTKASWDPLDHPDQRAKRWVFSRGKQPLPSIQVSRRKPPGALWLGHLRAFMAGSALLTPQVARRQQPLDRHSTQVYQISSLPSTGTKQTHFLPSGGFQSSRGNGHQSCKD